MLKKFVYVTGFLDYIVGITTAAPAFILDDPMQFPSLLSLGAFLCFAAASLMWASHDLEQRGSIVVWQAFVRITAVISTLAAMQMGMVEGMMAQHGLEEGVALGILLGVCAFDTTVSTVYIVGTSRMEGHSFLGLLRGQPAKT